ncbi:MAG: AIR synthase-related protein, partial [Burkholderiales bacterium]
GYITGASGRNWSGYGEAVQLAASLGDVERTVLTDPQTSGGLLVSCAPESLDAVMAVFERHGFAQAAVVGQVTPQTGERPGLKVSN